MSVVTASASTYRDLVRTGTVLVDIFATWCGPCLAIAPVLEEVALARPDITIVKVNVDTQPEIAGPFHVYGIPLLVVLHDGIEIRRSVGYLSKDRILALLPPPAPQT